MSEDKTKTTANETASSETEEVSSRSKPRTARKRRTDTEKKTDAPAKRTRRKTVTDEAKETKKEPKRRAPRRKKAEPAPEPVPAPVPELPKYTVEYRELQIADTYAAALQDTAVSLPARQEPVQEEAKETAEEAVLSVPETITETAIAEPVKEETTEAPAQETAEPSAEEIAAETDAVSAEETKEAETTIFPAEAQGIETVQEEPAAEVKEEISAEETSAVAEEILPEEKAEEAPQTEEETPAEGKEEALAEEPIQQEEPVSEEVTEETVSDEIPAEEVPAAAEEKQTEEKKEEPVKDVFPDVKRKKSLFGRKQAHTIELSVNDLNENHIVEKNTPKADSSLILMTDLNTPLWRILFCPVWTAERYRRENKTSGLSAIYGVILKWGMAFLGLVLFLYTHLNAEPFSYARMTFTDASWVWARYTFAGTLAEFLCIWLITLVYRTSDPHISYKRVRMMATAPDFLIGILYLCAGLLLNVSVTVGVILFAAAAFTAPVFHDLCFVYTRGYPKWKKLLTVYVCGLITAAVLVLFTQYFAADLLKIFEAVLNI